MSLYRKLSTISFLKKSYASKFFFIAFIGIHLPLVGILFFVLYNDNTFSNELILFFSFLITLVVTSVTLLGLKNLVRPILLASKALNEYRNNRTLSQLPIIYQDEAGLLMRNIQELIYETETHITEKEDLMYMLSHDLKNFAGNPQGLAQLILKENPSESIKELAELICQSTELQFRYIDNFIKLLKDQDDIAHIQLDSKIIRLTGIIPFIKEQIEQRLIDKKIKIDLKITMEEAKLKIDEALLIQVLVNLISNAIKFSYYDSTITIKMAKEKNDLVISVSDKGIGFNQAQIEELFKKFTKMSKLGTDNELSTGIGLYLCKKIIVKSGGQLLALSEGKNKGAEFKIVFPL